MFEKVRNMIMFSFFHQIMNLVSLTDLGNVVWFEFIMEFVTFERN